MPLNEIQIQNAFNAFQALRNSDHRYASFDYCYNYFHGFQNKSELASSENIEKSCLHLGFYLASWGMYRASSFLLKEKSLRFYIPIVKWIANECPQEVWTIDVNNYSEGSINTLIEVYKKLGEFIPPKKRKIVLVTKIMLGVFGNTPAFDKYFTKTFREHCNGQPAFRSYNKKSLTAIKDFYEDNNELIEELRRNCKTFKFSTGNKMNILYTKAKVIDMIGFGHSYRVNND